jgi:hypothetical protein
MSILRCITLDDYRREAKMILHNLDTLRYNTFAEDDMIEYLMKYLIDFQHAIRKYDAEPGGDTGYGRY